MNYLKEKVIKLIQKEKYPVYCLVINCSSINQVDSTAITGLIELKQLLLENYECEMLLCCVKPPVLKVFERGGLTKIIPKTNFFDEMHEAMLNAENIALKTSRKIKAKEIALRSISQLDLASFAVNNVEVNINDLENVK